MWENLFIGVAGMIGAGKSTLAKALGEHLGLDVHYEPVADNEYLEDFYRDTHRLIYRAGPIRLNRPFAVIEIAVIWACMII